MRSRSPFVAIVNVQSRHLCVHAFPSASRLDSFTSITAWWSWHTQTHGYLPSVLMGCDVCAGTACGAVAA